MNDNTYKGWTQFALDNIEMTPFMHSIIKKALDILESDECFTVAPLEFIRGYMLAFINLYTSTDWFISTEEYYEAHIKEWENIYNQLKNYAHRCDKQKKEKIT